MHLGLDKASWIVQESPSAARKAMAKSEITGRRKLKGNHVSHSNIKTKRWQHVNVQRRRVWVPELGRYVTLKLSTRDIRTIDRVGLVAFAKKHGYRLPRS